MTVHNFLNFIVICLFISLVKKSIADVCVMKTPCSCVFPNGTGYDLSPSQKPDFYSAQMFRVVKADKEYELSTYYLHPCSDILPASVPTTAADTCSESLSLYRTMSEFKIINSTNANETILYNKTAEVCNYLGSTTEIQFSPDGQSITYDHKPSEEVPNHMATIVRLICTTKNDSSLYVTDLSEPNNVVLSFYSKEACLKELEMGGRSLGSTLLIIFFSFLIFYLVLGICTKKFLMGATGIEVIPNLTFWTDLPNLVKDGWLYLVSGCKVGAGPGAAGAGVAAASPDPRSYDSI